MYALCTDSIESWRKCNEGDHIGEAYSRKVEYRILSELVSAHVSP